MAATDPQHSSDYDRGRNPDMPIPDDVPRVEVPVPLLVNCRAAIASGHRSEALLGALDRWIASADAP